MEPVLDRPQAEGERPVARLFALEASQGCQPIVFLHGLGRNHTTFLDLARALPDFWNPWLIDFRGHGDSPRVPGRYHVVDYQEDVLGWLRNRFNAPVVLYGHSLGAMVAAGCAAASEGEIAAIVLEDPPFDTMGRKISGTFWEYYFSGVAQVLRERRGTEEILEGLGEILVPVNGGDGLVPLKEVRDSQTLQFSAQCLAKVDLNVFAPLAEGRWLERCKVHENPEAIRCPVILLQGNPELGGTLSDRDAEAFQKRAPACRLYRFPKTATTSIGLTRAKSFQFSAKLRTN